MGCAADKELCRWCCAKSDSLAIRSLLRGTHTASMNDNRKDEEHMSDYQLLINGQLVDGDHTMAVVNPANEENWQIARKRQRRS